jgi:putative phosphatase
LIRLLTPDGMADRVEDITLERLTSMGVRGVALDLDNTIVPWHTADVTPAVSAWVSAIRQGGMRMCLVTNNYASHAADVARDLGIPIVAGALKPLPVAFRSALAALGVPAANSAVIGDQLFTDVLGGKLLGMQAILVKPIGGREFFTTRLMRMMERPLLARMRTPQH